MNLPLVFEISQIIIAVILIVLILMQQRGGGLSGVFGGGGEFYGTRRGFEKGIFTLTIVFACLLVISAIARLLIS